MGRSDNPDRIYRAYEPKPQGQHIERAPSNSPTVHDGSYVVDETLIRAENEDKITPYLLIVILVAALAGFLFGYDTGVIGSALPLVGEDLGHILTYSEQEIITASLTIGALVSSAVLGTLADRLGRKWSLFIADVFFTIGSVIVAASYSVPQIIVGRLLLGFGVGGASVIAPLYITELAPTAIRGRCLGVNAFFIPFGQVVSSAVGAGVQNTPHGWRILFAIGVIPSMLQLILMEWYLPESPRVMILRSQDDQAKATLRKVYRDASEDIIELKFRVAKNYVEATTQLQRGLSPWQRIKKVWTHGPYRRAIITVSGLQMFTQLTGFNTLLYYSGTIFGLFGFSNPALGGLIPSGINALFVFIGMSIVDKVGRRRLALCGIPVMILGLTWAIVSVYFMTAPTDRFLVAGYSYDQALAGSLVGAIALFVVGYGISYSHLGWYQSEFLALEIRAVGSAISTCWVWIANLTVSVSYLTQLETITPAGTFALYLGFVVVGWVFVWFCYPESKGISVDEIQTIYKDGFGVKASEELRASKAEAKKRMNDAEASAGVSTQPTLSPTADDQQTMIQVDSDENIQGSKAGGKL